MMFLVVPGLPGCFSLAASPSSAAPPRRTLPQGAGAAGRSPGGKPGGAAGEEEEAPPEEVEEEEEDVPEDDDYYQARHFLHVCWLVMVSLLWRCGCSATPTAPTMACLPLLGRPLCCVCDVVAAVDWGSPVASWPAQRGRAAVPPRCHSAPHCSLGCYSPAPAAHPSIDPPAPCFAPLLPQNEQFDDDEGYLDDFDDGGGGDDAYF